jgi:hypothetical protein
MGCGGDDFQAPADVAGNYTTILRNGPNGCGFENWTEGAVTENVSIIVEQDASNAVARVEGLAGVYVAFVLGTAEFSGSVSGSNLSLGIQGTTGLTQGACTYNLNALLEATVSGDAMAGTITYAPRDNGRAECSDLAGCENQQTLNGIRPPKQ